MKMPVPNYRIEVLASRLAAYSVAVNALSRVQEEYPVAQEVPGDARQMREQLATVKEQYLAFREEFETLRADHEHQFMAWHTELTHSADKRFTGDGAPQASAWKGKVPEWADEESRTAAEAAAALEEALQA